mmetsp:Transcript_30952/g.28148  ORF Transcript_30952/g.28148 Transcript_30952/m.28148 type:complete len:114 (-) Transcript_30952:331-672(-)
MEDRNKKKNKSSSFFNLVDLFSDPIYLHIKGRRTLTTSFGGILSIVLIMILLAQASVQFIQMFGRINPQITQITEIQDVPSMIRLNRLNVQNQSTLFNFAIGITIDGANNPLE